jgi:UDP-GlcNAc:undecaprenyl-phosphate/decaprenyl-phosphate GlcNAc-1-phosphate transferase
VSFPVNVYLSAVASALVTALVALPFWRGWCIRKGLVDDPGHRKIHDQPIPLAGGLTVMTAVLVPTVLAAIILWCRGALGPAPSGPIPSGPDSLWTRFLAPLDSNTAYLLRYGLGRRGLELAGIMGGAIGMLLVGWLDDKKELRPAPKFAGQFLVALLVAASGVRITLFIPNPLFHYAVTILWILTIVNAFNFIDNMNGLCAGLGAIGTWYFAVVAAADGQYLVALIAFLTFGALVGFLPYNFPRARAFLGDAGSHLVGFLLAVLAILPHFYTLRHPRKWAVLIPLLVLAIPLLDMAQVVIHRWRIGKPFYVGDTNHLSHRLVALGLSRLRAVLLLWLAAAVLGALIYLL